MTDDLTELKAAARKAAFAARKAAKSAERDAAANRALQDALVPFKGQVLAGYMPIRTEVDPLPTMTAMAGFGPVAVPVIEAEGKPLKFREWRPDAALVDGPFGAKVPAEGAWLVPQVVIVPLVAFDARGGRLGYGGGFYDRTLEGLRGRGRVTAIGFAFAAQEARDLPLEPTDQPLDMLVTEAGVVSVG